MIIHQGMDDDTSYKRWMSETSDKKCMDGETSDIDEKTSDDACKSTYARGARKK